MAVVCALGIIQVVAFSCLFGYRRKGTLALSRSGTNQAHKLTLEFYLTDYPSTYRKKQKNGS